MVIIAAVLTSVGCVVFHPDEGPARLVGPTLETSGLDVCMVPDVEELDSVTELDALAERSC